MHYSSLIFELLCICLISAANPYYGHHHQPNGKCLSPSDVPVAENIDENFFNPLRLWYFPGSTYLSFNETAAELLGRPHESQQELEEMCSYFIHGNLFSEPNTGITGGYGVQVSWDCRPGVKYGVTLCGPDSPPGRSHSHATATPDDSDWTPFYLVKTDNKSYAIWYWCNAGIGDVELKTTRPHVSPQIAKIFEDEVTRLRIKLKDVTLLKCSSPDFS